MQILLFNPPAYKNKPFIREGRCNQECGVWSTLWPPITLATAGAVLESNGYIIDILDCSAQGIKTDELLLTITKNDYKLIVWTSATPSITSDLKIANKIKYINPETITATIGTHVTALSEKCLNETIGLDIIIRNEPEYTLLELCSCIKDKKEINTISGISFKKSDGSIFHNPNRGFIKELDNLPFPAWHHLDLSCYKLPLIGEKFLIISPIRGCPYQCTFCTAQTYYGKKLRKRSPKIVIEEIKYNLNRFGINHFFIWADTFTADKEYVSQFCTLLEKNNLEIRWTCNSRVDTVDKNMLKYMARNGCWMISYGIESGNQDILDSVKKSITLNQVKKAVINAKLAGIKIAGHFILGFPDENEKTIKDTIRFALSLNLEVTQFYAAVPFPGSSLYENAIVNGWIKGQKFEDFSQNNAVMNLPGLPPAKVNHYRRKGNLKLYLNPFRFLKLANALNLKSFNSIFKSALSFIRWIF